MTQNSAGSPVSTGLPAVAAHLEGATAMTTIGGSNEDVSIEGTAISHIPLTGQPEFDGLMVDEKGNAVARIRDGALVHEIGDIDVAIGWRTAWTAAVSHMVIHRQKREGRS